MSSHSVETCTRLGCHDGRFLSRHHVCECADVAYDRLHGVDGHVQASRGEVGTGAGEGAPGQDTGSAWVTRSADCPEAPAQAHLPAPSAAEREAWARLMARAAKPRRKPTRPQVESALNTLSWLSEECGSGELRDQIGIVRNSLHEVLGTRESR